MSQENLGKEAIPFFTIQGATISLQPEAETVTEEVWLQKEKLMMAILDSINDGVFTIDFNMKITSFNRAAEKITGYSAEEAIGKYCMEVFCDVGGARKECFEHCPMKKSIKFRTPITKKRRINNKNGEILIVSATTNLLLDFNNQPIGGVEVFADITAFEQLKEKWQGKKYNLGEIVGKSPQMTEIYELIESISDTLANVFIRGETGTGKGIIARTVHYHSSRHKGPFVHVNCAAIPDTLIESELFGHVKGAFTGAINDKIGKFEQAHRGTIFLDEICELSSALQAKLLRVVEEKQFERVGGSKTHKIDVRIISATNCNLEEGIRREKCRQDLFYRLNTIPINLPPLLERSEDIPLLVEHFIDKFNYKMEKNVRDVAHEVLDIFMQYSWPGNVRELESTLEYALIQCDGNHLDTGCLPPYFRVMSQNITDVFLSAPETSTGPIQIVVPKLDGPMEAEYEMLLKALSQCRWNRTQTAKHLNVSRTTLWRLMKKYKLA